MMMSSSTLTRLRLIRAAADTHLRTTGSGGGAPAHAGQVTNHREATTSADDRTRWPTRHAHLERLCPRHRCTVQTTEARSSPPATRCSTVTALKSTARPTIAVHEFVGGAQTSAERTVQTGERLHRARREVSRLAGVHGVDVAARSSPPAPARTGARIRLTPVHAVRVGDVARFTTVRRAQAARQADGRNRNSAALGGMPGLRIAAEPVGQPTDQCQTRPLCRPAAAHGSGCTAPRAQRRPRYRCRTAPVRRRAPRRNP